jgi:hypothetical protein
MTKFYRLTRNKTRSQGIKKQGTDFSVPCFCNVLIYYYFFAGIKLFIFVTIFWIIVIVGTGVGTGVGASTVAFAFGAAAFFAGAAYMETSEIAKSTAISVIMIFFMCFSPPFSIVIIQCFYCRFG